MADPLLFEFYPGAIQPRAFETATHITQLSENDRNFGFNPAGFKIQLQLASLSVETADFVDKQYRTTLSELGLKLNGLAEVNKYLQDENNRLKNQSQPMNTTPTTNPSNVPSSPAPFIPSTPYVPTTPSVPSTPQPQPKPVDQPPTQVARSSTYLEYMTAQTGQITRRVNGAVNKVWTDVASKQLVEDDVNIILVEQKGNISNIMLSRYLAVQYEDTQRFYVLFEQSKLENNGFPPFGTSTYCEIGGFDDTNIPAYITNLDDAGTTELRNAYNRSNVDSANFELTEKLLLHIKYRREAFRVSENLLPDEKEDYRRLSTENYEFISSLNQSYRDVGGQLRSRTLTKGTNFWLAFKRIIVRDFLLERIFLANLPARNRTYIRDYILTNCSKLEDPEDSNNPVKSIMDFAKKIPKKAATST
jgi:hypothetical protein